jgi:hypothetical protein
MTFFRRTQFGTLTVVAVGGAVVLTVLIAANTGWQPVTVVVLVFLAVALALFCTLTVVVDESKVLCSFGPGLIRKKLPVTDIVAARPVRNKWYYGWGIRLTPSGWMYNVSGLDAVEVDLVSGKRFRIGTDRPDELTRAVQQAAGSTSSGWEPNPS